MQLFGKNKLLEGLKFITKLGIFSTKPFFKKLQIVFGQLFVLCLAFVYHVFMLLYKKAGEDDKKFTI